MDLIITFPGGRKVDAEYKGHTIHTDQSVLAGGENSAPAPFDYFLSSIGTCSGIYVVDFCANRGIPLEGIRIVQRMERDPEKKMISLVSLDIEVPPGFPEKYRKSLIRVVDLCSVKKHILDPPEFAIQVVERS
jgi:putative redox protein